jgi:ATP-binding cassette, subfamily B, bacterial
VSRNAKGRDKRKGLTDSSLRSVIGPFLTAQRHRLVLLSVTSIIGGFAEAVVLVLIARLALALVDTSSRVKVGVGPIEARFSLWFLIAVAGALVLVRFALNVWQARLSATTTSSVLANTRAKLVRLYLRARWSLQSSEREGRLQELLTTYAISASTTANGLSQGLVALFNLVALVLTAIIVNPVAAIAVGVGAGGIGFLLRPLRTQVRRSSRQFATANLEFATALTEFATSMQEVRIFGVEHPVRQRLDTLTANAAARQRRTRFLSLLVPATYQGVALILVVGSLGLVYAAGLTGLASLGAVVLIMLRSLTYGQTTQTALQLLHENAPFFETLQAESARYEAAGLPRGGHPVGTIGDLAFERVWFEYVPGHTVLRDLSFSVRQGEIVGVVGPTGAGKSTLVQLLLRLRLPTSGRFTVDGRDVIGLDLDDWYRRVAFVPQDSRLFAGSVEDNIRFFRDGVDLAAIEQAAMRAHLHDEVVMFPQGYRTRAGERGGEISGGQRQRICIARALIEDPDLLVLDEPTSALDARSESLMRQTLAELAPRTTVFVIAHRVSTLSICSRIMVINQGTLQHFDEPGRLEQDNAFYREVLQLAGMR